MFCWFSHEASIFHYDFDKLIFNAAYLATGIGSSSSTTKKETTSYTCHLYSLRTASVCGGYTVHPPPPSTLYLSFYPYLPYPSFRDARGILNPVLQHWWIRFTRKLFPYVSPRASFSYSYEIHTSSNSTSSHERRRLCVLDQSNYSPKFPTTLHLTGQDIFHTWIDRSSFRGRNTSFQRNHCTGEWGWKTGIFRTMVASCVRRGCIFQRYVQASRIVQKLTFCNIRMYVLRRKQRNITESKMQNFFTQLRKGVLRARVFQFCRHGMRREVRPRRSPGWERIKRE